MKPIILSLLLVLSGSLSASDIALDKLTIECAIKKDKAWQIGDARVGGLAMFEAVKRYKTHLDIVRWVYSQDITHLSGIPHMKYTNFYVACMNGKIK